MNRSRFLIKLILLLNLLFEAQQAASQDLSILGKEKAFKISGGVNTTHQFNSVRKNNPYNYLLGANLNIDFYGWAVPVSFTYSNRQHSFQQPFNQYGISPVYKWVTLHAGYRSMNFSNYTYSGQRFKGIGIELSPDIGLKIATFYGQLQKAVQPDTTLQTSAEYFYKRIGYGTKIEYSSKGFSINSILFKAKDQESSLDYIPVNSEKTPQENLALSIGGSCTLYKGLIISGELASSALTSDLRSPHSIGHGIYSKSGDIFIPRTSSDYFLARKASITYNFLKSTIGLGYENVDPGYKTLGGYYFNNDLLNYTLNFSQNLLKNKINFSANAGFEKNNLDNTKTNETHRLVFAGNIGLVLSQQLNFNAAYSNFKSYTNATPDFNNLNQPDPNSSYDTLNYRQVSQNANLGVIWNFSKSKKIRKNINLNVSFQKNANDGSNESTSGSNNFSESISYLKSGGEKGTTLSFSITANQMLSEQSKTAMLGPAISTGKSLLTKKMRVNIMVGYNRSYVKGMGSGNFSFRSSNSLILKKKHNLIFNLSYMITQNSNLNKAGNINLSLGYAFRF